MDEISAKVKKMNPMIISPANFKKALKDLNEAEIVELKKVYYSSMSRAERSMVDGALYDFRVVERTQSSYTHSEYR